jgi:hypothetical protein
MAGVFGCGVGRLLTPVTALPKTTPVTASAAAVDPMAPSAWGVEARLYACRERLAAQRCRTVACLRTQTAVLQDSPWTRLRNLKGNRTEQWYAAAEALQACLRALGTYDESDSPRSEWR